MSEKDNTPGDARPSAAPFSEEDALDRILKKSAELDVFRRRQALLACLGVVLILAILILFIRNLICFGTSFDSRKLAEKTVAVAVHDLAQDHELMAMKEDFRSVFVPALKNELETQLKDSLPKMQEALETERVQLSNHLQNATRERILRRIHKSFAGVESRLVAKHGAAAPSSADLEKALKKTEDALLSDTETQLKTRLESALKSLSALNNAFLAFKEQPEYATYAAMSQGALESKLIESFLELWIYHINPDRGALPAAQKGGI